MFMKDNTKSKKDSIDMKDMSVKNYEITVVFSRGSHLSFTARSYTIDTRKAFFKLKNGGTRMIPLYNADYIDIKAVDA